MDCTSECPKIIGRKEALDRMILSFWLNSDCQPFVYCDFCSMFMKGDSEKPRVLKKQIF